MTAYEFLLSMSEEAAISAQYHADMKKLINDSNVKKLWISIDENNAVSNLTVGK